MLKRRWVTGRLSAWALSVGSRRNAPTRSGANASFSSISSAIGLQIRSIFRGWTGTQLPVRHPTEKLLFRVIFESLLSRPQNSAFPPVPSETVSRAAKFLQHASREAGRHTAACRQGGAIERRD